jgi:hypothetical protein
LLLLSLHETSLQERQEEERLRARARALIYEAEPNEEVEIQRAREKVRGWRVVLFFYSAISVLYFNLN